MDDRYRGDDPRRSVHLASSANNGATRDRAPLPLGVNERTRGVGSRPMNGRPANERTADGPQASGHPTSGAPRSESPRQPAHPQFHPPARSGNVPTHRGPRPAHPDRPTYDRPACPALSQRPLNRSYAHAPSGARHNMARGGYRGGHPGGPHRGHRRGSGRIFSHPTWRSLLFSPRGIAFILVLAIIGAGGLGIHTAIQRGKAEETARIEAQKEKERLAKQRVSPTKLGPTVVPVSTPRSAWQAGSMPHLYQTDPAWASAPYAGNDVRTAACGPTCLTMVYVYLTGKTDLDPAGMAAFADEHNFAPTGATEWRFMTDGASMLGIRSSAVAPNRASIVSALDAGKPVICSVSAGDFTTIGHFIVLKSIDERGMVEAYDPNSPFNSAKRWPVGRILTQADALWCFSL